MSFDIQNKTQNTKHKTTIVIPIVAGIGNALMAEPMVRQLRDAMPEARIVTVALIAPMAAVFQGIDRIETIITGRGSKNLLKGIRATRTLKPDIYLVPFPSNRWQYNVMAAASGAKRVIIHGYPIGKFGALGFLHGNRVPAVRGVHDVIQNLNLLKPLGIETENNFGPRFISTREQSQAAKTKLDAVGLIDRRFAIMHAGSAKTILAEAKRWPSENYGRVACAIANGHQFDVLIVEGPDEAGVSDEILSHCPDKTRIRALKLTGPLGESAAILSHASFYVGTDSGLAHLSAAVGIPAITLFAPADPDRVSPFGYRDLVVQPLDGKSSTFLYPWQATKPKLPAGELGRIKLITVEQVMEKVRQLLQRTGSDSLPP